MIDHTASCWRTTAATLVAAVALSLDPNSSAAQSGAAGLSYRLDLERASAIWPGEPPIREVEDLFRVVVELPEDRIVVESHLFGPTVVIIPFANEDGVTDAGGLPVARGDQALAELFLPGEIGIAVRHRRAEHRLLSLGASVGELKEELKFRDGHAELLVGVIRQGQPGVITLNMPQGYEGGRFATANYPLIFFQPVLPAWLDEPKRLRFRDNIRTLMLGFDSVARFPLSYMGGDPLAARDPEAVREHTDNLVRAIAGDTDARAWFRLPANQLYCSELGHLAISAGLLLPLNDRTFVPRVGADVWARFKAQVTAHNRDEPSAFDELNDNPLASLVELAIAPEDLEPVFAYAPNRRLRAERLAFTPMTLADMTEQWLRAYLPRERLGEDVAPLQAKLLVALKPALWSATEIDRLPEGDPRLIEADTVFAGLVATLGARHASYRRMRSELAPWLERAAAVANPRPGTGAGLFIPPSLFHLIAQGRWPADLAGVRYVGHGLHYSMVRRVDPPATDTPEH